MELKEIENLVPVKKCEEEVNNGIVTVKYYNNKVSFFEKHILRSSKAKLYKIDLDEIGSYIWKNCDGKMTVESITRLAEEKFGDKISPAKERVSLFIKQMAETKLIELYKVKLQEGYENS